MKVRLLKKLREKAKKEYWIEYQGFPSKFPSFGIRKKDKKEFVTSFVKKEHALNYLNSLRREFILTQFWRKLDY